MTAYHYLITHRGHEKGHGLVVPETRYASIRWRGADRLARVAEDDAAWPEVDTAPAAGSVALPHDSALGRLFGLAPPDREGYALHFLRTVTTDGVREADGSALDRYLDAQTFD